MNDPDYVVVVQNHVIKITQIWDEEEEEVPRIFEPRPKPKVEVDKQVEEVSSDRYEVAHRYVECYDPTEAAAIQKFDQEIRSNISMEKKMEVLFKFIDGGVDTYIKEIRGIAVGMFKDERFRMYTWICIDRLKHVFGMNRDELTNELKKFGFKLAGNVRADRRARLDKQLSAFKIDPTRWVCYRK